MHHAHKAIWITLIFVVALRFTDITVAHEDPLGDVHPTVTAVSDEFTVTYLNNSTNDLFEMHVSKSGEVTTPPVRISGGSSYLSELVLAPLEPSCLFRGVEITFPPIRLHEKHHFTTVDSDGCTQRWFFEDEAFPVKQVHQVLCDADHATLLIDPDDRGEVGVLQFLLAQPDNREFARIGRPARIYMFPVVSNLLIRQLTAYLAWIDNREDATHTGYECRTHDLILTKWVPGTRVAASRTLMRNVSWNTHLSVASIGTDALLAFHQGSRKGGSKIQLVSFKLE